MSVFKKVALFPVLTFGLGFYAGVCMLVGGVVVGGELIGRDAFPFGRYSDGLGQ